MGLGHLSQVAASGHAGSATAPEVFNQGRPSPFQPASPGISVLCSLTTL